MAAAAKYCLSLRLDAALKREHLVIMDLRAVPTRAADTFEAERKLILSSYVCGERRVRESRRGSAGEKLLSANARVAFH